MHCMDAQTDADRCRCFHHRSIKSRLSFLSAYLSHYFFFRVYIIRSNVTNVYSITDQTGPVTFSFPYPLFSPSSSLIYTVHNTMLCTIRTHLAVKWWNYYFWSCFIICFPNSLHPSPFTHQPPVFLLSVFYCQFRPTVSDFFTWGRTPNVPFFLLILGAITYGPFQT